MISRFVAGAALVAARDSGESLRDIAAAAGLLDAHRASHEFAAQQEADRGADRNDVDVRADDLVEVDVAHRHDLPLASWAPVANAPGKAQTGN